MTIKDGDIFKIKYEHIKRTWCRHNIVIAREQKDGSVYLIDTYWGSGDGSYRPEDLEGKTEYIGNIHEYRDAYPREFEQFGEGERFFIPMGGGGERRLVKKSATPDKELIRRQLETEIEDLKKKNEWNERGIVEKTKELSAL